MGNKCNTCPRRCGAHRTAGSGSGFCQMGYNPVVARVAPHHWEEPCISGKNGSGTVFFSGCVLKCVYCQNYKISNLNVGKVITPTQLAALYKQLEEQGVHNINLVNPTHFAYAIIESLSIYKPKIPIVYNSSGYENRDLLQALNGYIDIYLPDFKYAFDELAVKYSSAQNYKNTALRAIKEMITQKPNLIYDDNNILQGGVIIRHLVLPSNTKNSIAALTLLKEHFGNSDVLFSIMAQYTPCGKATDYKEINRTITRREYEKVLTHAEELNINGFVQDLSTASKAYIPDFYS
ncbi:radical SAM protein [Clostridia bacterium]|nr:radical SAM protein [Clostridia bacterium]